MRPPAVLSFLPVASADGKSTLLLSGSVCLAAGAVMVGFVCWLPDVADLRVRNPMTTRYVQIYVNRKTRAGQRPATSMRWVPIGEMSPHLVNAVLIAEDDRFFRHHGVDWRELKKALKAGLRGERIRGASTISQQVARNLFLSPRKSYGRKVKETLIARHLERTLGKERVLEIYLNIAEWGEGVFGAEAASRAYYRKGAASLTPEEAVELAAALPSPYERNPLMEPDERLAKLRALYLERLLRRAGGAPSVQAP